MSPSRTPPPARGRRCAALVLELHDRRAVVSEEIGMSYLRAKALSRLVPGPLTQRELSGVLMTDAPYTSVIVDDLEQRGLATREVNPADRRSKLVRITSAGRAVARKAQRIQSTPPAVLETLSARELATLERTLRLLVERSEETQ